MLYTTFALAHKSEACTGSYRKMAQALGGVSHYGENTSFSLAQVVAVLGLNDAIWCLRCTTSPAEAENILIEFACRCAERVLTNYEKKYPTDKRPRLAIEAARLCITDKTPAARAAADATAYAAYAAARAAYATALLPAPTLPPTLPALPTLPRCLRYRAAYATADAAAYAARAAAYAADATAYAADAADATASAAYATRAAYAAELEWHTQTFRALLEGK